MKVGWEPGNRYLSRNGDVSKALPSWSALRKVLRSLLPRVKVVIIFSHHFLVPFIIHPLQIGKLTESHCAWSKVREGSDGEKSPRTSRENINSRTINDDSSRSHLDADIWPYASHFCMPSSLDIFSTQYKLNYCWCLHIITYRISQQILEIMRVKFVLEGSFLLPRHLNVGFSNNEFLNIFVIQEKKIVTETETWIWKRNYLKYFLRFVFHESRKKKRPHQRHNLSVSFIYLTGKKNSKTIQQFSSWM